MRVLVVFFLLFLDHRSVLALLCYFCKSDHRTATDDCISVKASTRLIQCIDSEKCVVALHRDEIHKNLTGEIERDCLLHSRALIPGEYESCSRNRCNDFNYPQDRLQCQQCKNCVAASPDPAYCRLYFKYHSACVSYVDMSSGELMRGCQTDMEDNFCDKGSQYCVYCMYDNCNRDPRQRTMKLSCYQCDRNDPQCSTVQDYTGTKATLVHITMGTAVYCWTMFAGVNNGVVFRFHETHRLFGKYFTQFCGTEKISSPQCVRCFGNLCNKHYEPGRCFECLEGNPDCDDRGKYLTPMSCVKHDMDDFGCYGMVMDTTSVMAAPLRRGCISDLDYLYQKSCAESNSCFFCRSKNCNRRVNICYKCIEILVSVQQNPFVEPGNVSIVSCLTRVPGQKWEHELCGNEDSCFLKIETLSPTETLVERGCLSGNFSNGVNELLNPATFQLCNDYKCNKWESLSVHQSCYNMKNEEVPCPTPSNWCFMAYYLTAKGEGVKTKGCYDPQKKFQGEQAMCDKHFDTCELCSGHLCNDKKHHVKMRLRCAVCNNRDECMFYNDTRALTKCRGDRHFFQAETCFYGIDRSSKNITRGCTLVKFPGRKTPPLDLLYCTSSGCNLDSVNDYYCYQCDSNSPYSAPGYCFKVTGAKGEVILKPSPCEGGPDYMEEEKGCYTYLTPTGVLKRGCIRHLTMHTVFFCQQNQSHCNLCYNEGCNKINVNGDVPLVAFARHLFFSVTILTLIRVL